MESGSQYCEAIASERSEMLQTLLRYVTVDVDARTAACLAPKNEFAALFKAAIQLLNADLQSTEATGVASSRDVKDFAHGR